MEDDIKLSPHRDAGGKTPTFLKLLFLVFILWAAYYLWKNVLAG
jgi:hypothetical protein